MKNAMFLLCFFALSLSPGIAQEFEQWGLPEGAAARLGKGRISQIKYSPDGTRLAVASTIGIWLYDTATHQEVALLAGQTYVDSVAFSPDGSTIACGSWPASIRLWDAETGDHLRKLKGHLSLVFSVAFSPDGRTMASGSEDGTVLLWDFTGTSAYQVEPSGRRITALGNIKRTALLQNFPNPFNPETWIPYQLGDDTVVTLKIYDQKGHIVRNIDVGRKNAGIYRDRASAAYWDGRNQNGEPVTSGAYFYQLHAGDYTSLRQMVILK